MHPFLLKDEEVIYELKTETKMFIVTNSRFITQRTLARKKGQLLEEFCLKYIGHNSIEAKEGKDDRLIGAILTTIGIITFAFGYYYPEYYYTPYVIGALFFVSGIILLFSKVEPTSTLTIELIGIPKEYKYEIPGKTTKSISLWKHLRNKQLIIESPIDIPE